MTTEEHLQKILAKCRANLEIAAKRTPGKWAHYSDKVCSETEFHDADEVDNVDVCQGITWRKLSPKQKIDENLDFIAACAGSAEAGWRATIAAIDEINLSHDWTCVMACDIIAAWPEELM